MARILVTGGAGYIGSVLVPELLEEGHHVHVVDNFMYGQYLSLAPCFSNPLFTIEKIDIRYWDVDKLRNFDVIIPLAALVGAPLCEQHKKEAHEINYSTVVEILDYLVDNQLVIFPNTNSGYGMTGTEPVTENYPLKPISTYGKTKVLAEKYVLDYSNAISLRLATVYGVSPRMRLDLLVNDFCYRAVRDKAITVFEGDFRRSIVYIHDVVRAFIFAINNWEKMRGEAYNVVNHNLTKTDLCRYIQKFIPDLYFTEYNTGKDPDKRDYYVSTQKLLNTGFEYGIQNTLASGIQELIKAFSVISNERYGNV